MAVASELSSHLTITFKNLELKDNSSYEIVKKNDTVSLKQEDTLLMEEITLEDFTNSIGIVLSDNNSSAVIKAEKNDTPWQRSYLFSIYNDK